MSKLTATVEWQALRRHREALGTVDLPGLFAGDPNRAATFSASAAGLHLDFSKQPITAGTIAGLLALADARGLRAGIEAMFSGEVINRSEQRAVLHVALRDQSSRSIRVDGHDVAGDVQAVRERMLAFCTSLTAAGQITDVVNLGIGGSDLGPRLASAALRPFAGTGIRAHYVSNVDAAALAETLAGLTPERTLFIIASKSFTTAETLLNARTAREWLRASLPPAEVGAHLAAVTANTGAAESFGVAAKQVFGFWDWVGGRYSLWSAIGLPVLLEVGPTHFAAMLAGAHALDEHFRSAATATNLPVLLALLEIWQRNFLDSSARAVVPYANGLALLPQYLQQAEMESNGKAVDNDGNPVGVATAPVVFGLPGTDAQHAFFQQLHQGGQVVPVDFILPLRSEYPPRAHHDMLVANCLAQSEALLLGRDQAACQAALLARGVDAKRASILAPQMVCPGNRPSTTIVLERLDPASFGALLALYEHKIFVAGLIWGINSFDQWGVELGKTLAATLLPEIEDVDSVADHDGSTAALLDRARHATY